MAPTCCYFLCKSVIGQKSMFRFPTGDSRRLQVWIDNCGKKTFNNLSKEALRNKYICIDHFEKQYIQNEGGKRIRINKLAVPIRCRGEEATEVSPDSLVASSQGFRQTTMNEAQKKRLTGPAVRYGIFQDGMTKVNKDQTLEIDGVTCQPEEDYQCSDLMVRKPNKVYHNYHKQICAELAKESNRSNVRAVEDYCMECERPIHGFQWWCLQCSGVRCGKCAVRMSHRPHYILRTPANSTQEQTQAVLDAIRRHMSEEFFVRRPNIRHVDENGVDLTATEEPEVKAEPLEINDDPFACTPVVEDDPLSCTPVVEDDPLSCTPVVEDDPLACNAAEDDPLAECKPVVQDIPIAEPSIDYQPENSVNAQSLASREQADQNSPQKPLGVEIYSPVHPGLEIYEFSLAQCSGIDDFMCSYRTPIDSQSIDDSERQIDVEDFDDNRTSDDDHRPSSIQQPHVPTRYTYGEDNSEDSLEAIDYDQPSHCHIGTDTEQGYNQIRRPWVQVLSSQEQNTTDKTIQHKTQQKRLSVQPPPKKQQNILAKQQNIQTQRPWVQVFSNTEQQSTDAKHNNHNRPEQSHFQEICEEQTPTVPEIQDCHDPLQQSDDKIGKQIPTARVKRNSVGEKQTSTTTAKRKRKIIIIKKRANAHYNTIIQREFTEPSDDNNLQCAKEMDTSDINRPTEPTNTSFNLDDKNIVTIKKRSRIQYATHIQRDFPEPIDDNIDIDNNVESARQDTLDLNMTSEATNTLLNLDEYIRDRVLEYPPNIEELM